MIKLLSILTFIMSPTLSFANHLQKEEILTKLDVDVNQSDLMVDFDLDMQSLNNEQNIMIINAILQNDEETVLYFDFISDSSKDILIAQFTNKDDLFIQTLNETLQTLNQNSLRGEIESRGSWQYNRYHNVDGYKYFTRWNWWTYITGFWCLEASPELVELISWGSLTTAEGLQNLLELLEILSPITEVPVAGVAFIAAVTVNAAIVFTVWDLVNNGDTRGIYGDFVISVPGKTVKSNINWNSLN